ncbi:MAG: copper homeostasis protein CutC [Bacteroidales bacterium]|nr:copper homeostasis protein CutC [Bacteroidales bacterium]
MAFVEICVGSLNSSLAAQEGGANRIELCDNLYEGGTTPSYGTIKVVRKSLNIPIHVIIRPRGGDFLYNPIEFEAMKEDVLMCKDLGIAGVVIGILLADGKIDESRTAQLVALARPMSITFHRAFDMTPDPWMALSSLKALGIDRVLTSGQRNTAVEGSGMIKQLIKEAGTEIGILPGGGLNEENIEIFAKSTGAKEFHATLRSLMDSKMIFRNESVSMGGLPQIPEFSIKETDPEKVANFVSIINKTE